MWQQRNKEEGVDSHPEVLSPRGPLEAQSSGDRVPGVAKGTWNTGLPQSWMNPLPGPREKVSVTQSWLELGFWSRKKKKEANIIIVQWWAGRGVRARSSLMRNAAGFFQILMESGPQGHLCGAVLGVQVWFFPEPWHWGARNGSTCCNATRELLLVTKLLQQPLH